MLNLQNALGLLIEKLISWYELVIQKIPNFVVAIVVVFIFLTIAKSVKQAVKKFIPKLSTNRSVNSLMETLSFMTILLIGMFVALEILGLDKAVTSILAGAGVIGLALGFAFQEIASNFVSGIFIAFQEPYQIGDIIQVEDSIGKVKNIELRTTCITTFEGLEVYIPNKDMFTKTFTNFTSTPERRLDLRVGVSYGDNLKEVEKITLNALEGLPHLRNEHKIEIFYEEFGSSSINFVLHIWLNYTDPKNYLTVRHEAIKRIKMAYDQHNITIPFPIRTLDFGIKGGKELGQILTQNKLS